ncbi:MAG: nicotinamide-nucleotide amidohydrolase family protein, partial [Cyanothece sp. SIO1E1]|nr:nicotinamide-nucleotide amidohydrolase family protein [Cyanothece sp. SIO1E1]
DTELEAVRELAETCIEDLGIYFLGYGKPGITPVVLDHLRAAAQTVAVAESCTGGMIGSAVTAVAGSSDVFLGGMLTYSNRAQHELLDVPQAELDEFGAVSEPVAIAMANGARKKLHSDWALSATGIAGPGGGTPGKPVGTVFVGLAGPGDIAYAKKLGLRGARGIIRERTVNVALDILRRELLK